MTKKIDDISKRAKGSFFQDVAQRSEKDNWQTPLWLFQGLDSYFEFDVDVCADENNALCQKYFTKQDSCLDKEWGNVNFLNPPYDRDMYVFMEKAKEEWKKGKTIVALVPSRTDTRWFHHHVYNKADIFFVKGRLNFELPDKEAMNAPFPSMIAVWHHAVLDRKRIFEIINDKSQMSIF